MARVHGIGFLVNPVAGLGGAAGLGGSDGIAVQRAARARGGSPRAWACGIAALAELAARRPVHVLTAPGSMGAELAARVGVRYSTLPVTIADPTTGADTTRCAQMIAGAPGVELLLFVGGDGTAGDVASGLAQSTPVLGVPAGVKMYSGCFAVTPLDAAATADHFLTRGGGSTGSTMTVEIVDLDEEALRAGEVRPRLTGTVRVPVGPAVQQRKAPATPDLAHQTAITAAAAAARLDASLTTALGPGGTTAAVLAQRGLTGTLLGVDIVDRDGLVALNVSERDLFRHVQTHPTQVMLSVIGGQGFLFGRGNQQFSPRILRAVGRDRIITIAPEAKLAALGGRPLLVDTGDPETDRWLAGYHRILTGPGRWTMYPVGGVPAAVTGPENEQARTHVRPGGGPRVMSRAKTGHARDVVTG